MGGEQEDEIVAATEVKVSESENIRQAVLKLWLK